MEWTEPLRQFEDLIESFNDMIPGMIVGATIMLLFIILARGAAWLTRRGAERQRRHRSLGLALSRLIEWGVLAVGILVAATVAFPTFTPGNLISTLGITSIAIGFAFRDILENFLAGLLILVTEPFRVDDQIVFETFEGTVEDIQTRATTIRTYDGRRVVIPNARLFTNAVTINTALGIRRLEYDFGIDYGDDISRAKTLAIGALQGVEGVLDEPAPDVLLVALGPTSPLLRVRWWIRPPRKADALDVQDRVLNAVKDTFRKNDIHMPYPTQRILLHDQHRVQQSGQPRQPQR